MIVVTAMTSNALNAISAKMPTVVAAYGGERMPPRGGRVAGELVTVTLEPRSSSAVELKPGR